MKYHSRTLTDDEFCVAVIQFFVEAAGGIDITKSGNLTRVTCHDINNYLEDEERVFMDEKLSTALDMLIQAWVRKTGHEHHYGLALLGRHKMWSYTCDVKGSIDPFECDLNL